MRIDTNTRLREVAFLSQSDWPSGPSFNPIEINIARGWHSAAYGGDWDAAAVLQDLGDCLIHSRRRDLDESIDETNGYWTALVFGPEERLFLALRRHGEKDWYMRVWADSAERARSEIQRLRATYLRTAAKEADDAEFYILSTNSGELSTRRIRVKPRMVNGAELQLHYGEDFAEWHRGFVKAIAERHTGVTIMQGLPGTGKTSYLRYLVHELRKTHRFYYLPTSVYPVLMAPAAVDFWVTENVIHERFTKVVVIEDAESLLMQRASDNQESVSNLLNIADGFLGEFLKLHVICTINAPVEKLDPAITRPGRLIASRRFRRLTAAEAQRLAAAREISLQPQEDYSLAEVYNSASLHVAPENGSVVGFTAGQRHS